MRRRFFAVPAVVAVLALAFACSGGSHPLAGKWSQETGSAAKGIVVEFDSESDKVFAHGAERPEGGHAHYNGTYTWDAATKTVTVKATLMGEGKSDTWTGKLDGEHLELSSPDGKLTFHHGGEAHGH